MTDLQAERERVHTAVQSTAPSVCPDAVLTGWVVTAEWMDSKGEKWLSGMRSEGLATWTADGMLHHALYGDMEPDEDG